MTIQEEVKRMVLEEEPPTARLRRGATEEQIAEFAARNKISVPIELQEWLRFRNGADVSPGGIFGIRPSLKYLDLERRWERHPNWRARGWIPIAGDGSGNYYVLDTAQTVGGTHPVYFMEHEGDMEAPEYVVASGLWTFLRFLLVTEKLQQAGQPYYWPFDQVRILMEDPAVRDYRGDVPLPWETEQARRRE